ncbi:MAG: right-handed parallel beta-helix repeat-containing protein [Candidatus Hydrogenedentes bacterium]|nr:right-handed parallel beta-helix repeat-containing protein [Candidatus Hydrogenedentota bacterium]
MSSARVMKVVWGSFAVIAVSLTAFGAPAFPGAAGFGADTPGGRGGAVLRVTNLDAEGPGSLRAALEAKGPRIVVFEVGGVIDLNKNGLEITEPFITIAGQTAPSPGITVIRGGIALGTHDIVIRHIRVRPGDAGEAKRSGWEPDGMSTGGAQCYDIVIDHCSLTWAVDENLSASGPCTKGPEATSHRITFSNCIIAEGLNNASHAKGPHSKGSLIHDCCQDIAIIGNLYAHNVQRNPYFKAHTTGAVVNNVIYNPGGAAIQVGFVPNEWANASFPPENCRISVVGNVLIHGADTRAGLALVASRGDAYMDDNLAVDRDGEPAPMTAGRVNLLDTPPAWPDGLEPLPAADTLEHVIRHVGARPKDRDAVDARIIRDLQSRRGCVIDSQDEVGGYPDPSMTQRPLEVPDDVDAWLNQLAAELE